MSNRVGLGLYKWCSCFLVCCRFSSTRCWDWTWYQRRTTARYLATFRPYSPCTKVHCTCSCTRLQWTTSYGSDVRVASYPGSSTEKKPGYKANVHGCTCMSLKITSDPLAFLQTLFWSSKRWGRVESTLKQLGACYCSGWATHNMSSCLYHVLCIPLYRFIYIPPLSISPFLPPSFLFPSPHPHPPSLSFLLPPFLSPSSLCSLKHYSPMQTTVRTWS